MPNLNNAHRLRKNANEDARQLAREWNDNEWAQEPYTVYVDGKVRASFDTKREAVQTRDLHLAAGRDAHIDHEPRDFMHKVATRGQLVFDSRIERIEVTTCYQGDCFRDSDA
jgi:hypothetical protein